MGSLLSAQRINALALATGLPGLPATLYKPNVTMYRRSVYEYIYYYHLVVSLPYHTFSW